ncbi:MAG: glycosyltransferase family 25 protein [Candidatus Devosia phytovorans]|uniref:Glycosyltransferase family 25 protein n=1 Tax=Candidatus Devosia phytovorans TaxID=3121372 RepID=A0AAJ5VRD2_9HYPH|nr:glycosyltransferase family 25 protein [Devosia sp.]WEK03209.1 MAG: glycosyltransferase family 25 protein [Devosia sp.]
MLPIFYINLASRPDRREFMDGQLQALGLSGTRIEAVTAADIGEEDAQAFCNLENELFLRLNELACTYSHERAWSALIASGEPAGLIFEDDAELASSLPAFLAEAASIDADLIRIETTGSTTRVYPVESTGPSGIAVRRFRSTPMGAAGYILKAEAARRLIGHPELRRRHLDLALYNPFEQPGASLTRVLTDPALCRQLGVENSRTAPVGRSDIAHERVKHTFARRHPVASQWGRLRRWAKKGLRNVKDDFAQRGQLSRRVIPFGDDQ